MKKGIAIFGISATVLLLIYQFGNAIGQFIDSMTPYTLPIEYYGYLALLFIAVTAVMLVHEFRGKKDK